MLQYVFCTLQLQKIQNEFDGAKTCKSINEHALLDLGTPHLLTPRGPHYRKNHKYNKKSSSAAPPAMYTVFRPCGSFITCAVMARALLARTQKPL